MLAVVRHLLPNSAWRTIFRKSRVIGPRRPSPARRRRIPGLALLLAALAHPAAAADLRVVVTIKPIHALVAQVMAGAGTPALIVDGAASPHTYSLKPSDARLLNNADVVFRVSEVLEPFTARVAASLPASVAIVTLAATPGLKLLARRTGATFEPDPHDHDHDKDGDHGAKPDAADADPHVWLNPDNARLMVARIAAVLAARAPGQAALFRANAVAADARIAEQTAKLEAILSLLRGRPFIVLHDAYQYFEARFGLAAAGSISISPEVPPSAQRLTLLRRKMATLGATCVFSEPQTDPRVVAAVTEGLAARFAELDPEGLTIAAGPELYAVLMSSLAMGMAGCLAQQ